MKFLYLLIIIFTFIFPLILSFDKKVHFCTNWKYLIPSVIVSMLVFIPWDILFTRAGVWGFNKIYISGIYLFNLPVEEWMFFIVVPYACIFIYEVLIAYGVKNYFHSSVKYISPALSVILLTIAFVNYGKIYTFITFTLASILIIINQYVLKHEFLSRFYLSYLVMLIPFFLVNGLLTGSFIPEEVVWYNQAENLGIRIFTIPLEDFVYGFSLILLNLTVYHFIKIRLEAKKFAFHSSGVSENVVN
ncbi:MAG: lycopene cyclase domain-containing protein [Sphingobacteriales bacterium]|nr:lycopene cyclase domain-containing protein [Sphingobacteriales bacterium]